MLKNITGEFARAFFFLFCCLLAACSSTRKTNSHEEIVTKVRRDYKHGANTALPKNDKKHSAKLSTVFTMSNSNDHPFLGIGSIVDYTTNLSRSFAFRELFQKNGLICKGDTLYPVLVDYPFNATYAITGFFKGNTADFKIYEKGKKVKEIITSSDWKDIYRKLSFAICETKQPIKKDLDVYEGEAFKFRSKNVSAYFPGEFQLNLPSEKIIDTFKHFASIRTYKNADPYEEVKEVFGTYSKCKEGDLFFFRNDQVPANIKEAARPLVFPLAYSIAPALHYLSLGYQLQRKIDLGASLNCFYSGLISSSKLLTSPYERALIRSLMFNEISTTHLMVSDKRNSTSALFKLGADLNTAYLVSPAAWSQRVKYYEGIGKIKDICATAETKAKEIRGAKRLGGFLAAISAAGSIASTSAYDNTVSNALMDQAQTTLTQYFDEANSASTLLDDQFKGVEDKIEAESFLISNGQQIEIGKPFVAAELCYYLLKRPETVKPVALQYAADKPKLKTLLLSYYSGSDNNKKSILEDIFRHVSEMEAKIVNTEVRGYSLSDVTKSSF